MKRPSFQFYPGDWQSNTKLRRCSPAARGIWLDILCVLHDSDEYGVCRWPLAELAQVAAAPMKLVKELIDKGVLKGHDKHLDEPYVYVPRSGRKDGDPVVLVPAQDGPIWYSSRMVKDEYVRTIRGENSRFGAEQGEAPKTAPKKTPKSSPKPPFGDGSSSSSSSSIKHSSSATPSQPPAEAREGGGEPAAPDDPPDSAVRISTALRSWEKDRGKFAQVNSANCADLAAMAPTDAELREAYDLAVQDREKSRDDKPVNANFVAAFVAKLRAPQRAGNTALPSSAWWIPAGFPDQFAAENAGCTQGTAYRWRDGKRIPETA